jgi:hypothetical protein
LKDDSLYTSQRNLTRIKTQEVLAGIESVVSEVQPRCRRIKSEETLEGLPSERHLSGEVSPLQARNRQGRGPVCSPEPTKQYSEQQSSAQKPLTAELRAHSQANPSDKAVPVWLKSRLSLSH